MPVQDLTPNLRTRLSRVERAVGIFVMVATLLLVAGFFFYLFQTAHRKGWFLVRLPYYTYLQSAGGIKEGDKLRLLGFEAGEVTVVKPMPPFSWEGNVYVQFDVVGEDNLGYIWDDSRIRITTGDFLGKRNLELIPGGGSAKTNKNVKLHATYLFEKDVSKNSLGLAGKVREKLGLASSKGRVTSMWDPATQTYKPFDAATSRYMLPPDEAPALTERLEQLAGQVERALPGILDMTNKVNRLLVNAADLTSDSRQLLADIKPAISNATVITANLRDPNGSLGNWLIPTNLKSQLDTTLGNANTIMTNVNVVMMNTDSNITQLTVGLGQNLSNIAGITSNLNAQVAANTNILSNISGLIITADKTMQGLQRHWLLRSAFKTNKPAVKAPKGK